MRQLQGQTGLNRPAAIRLGSWAHLAGRLFSVLGNAPLGEEESVRVTGWLPNPGVQAAFFQQPPYDQRHGLAAADVVAGRTCDRLDLIRAALLHDVGKRHSRLGPLGRSMASAWTKLGGKASRRWANYLDHGRLAEEELAAMGVEPIVVEYARSHHGERPVTIAADDWALLQAADRAL
ncbi:MAG: HDIG domain-containing metalloprotein [Actinomycetota bacterium]